MCHEIINGSLKVKEEIKKYMETNENENMIDPKSIGNIKSSSKREVYRNKSLPQEIIYIHTYIYTYIHVCVYIYISLSQINNLTLLLKELEKEEQTKPKVGRREEIIKAKAEINEIKTQKTIGKKSMKLGAHSLKR